MTARSDREFLAARRAIRCAVEQHGPYAVITADEAREPANPT